MNLTRNEQGSKLLMLLILILLISFGAIGCGSGSGAGGGGGGSCDGPVPCATTDWDDTYYEYTDADGEIVVITSDGAAFGGAGFTDDGFLLGLGGEVVDCYTGNILVGGMDYNLDGIIDEWFDTAIGKMKICDTELKVTNLILDGVPEENIVADYVGVARSTIQADQSDSAQAIISETLNRLREK